MQLKPGAMEWWRSVKGAAVKAGKKVNFKSERGFFSKNTRVGSNRNAVHYWYGTRKKKHEKYLTWRRVEAR